jgi:hypothetical protein
VAGASMTIVKDDAFKVLDNIVSRAKDPTAFIKTNLFRIYQIAQQRRWMSEGASENETWKPLNPKYAEYKRRRYGGGVSKRDGTKWPSYPGAGKKINIATSRLAGSVIGRDSGFDLGVGEQRVKVTPTSLYVGTVVPYAKEVDDVRNIFHFSKMTINNMKSAYAQFIAHNKKGF